MYLMYAFYHDTALYEVALCTTTIWIYHRPSREPTYFPQNICYGCNTIVLSTHLLALKVSASAKNNAKISRQHISSSYLNSDSSFHLLLYCPIKLKVLHHKSCLP